MTTFRKQCKDEKSDNYWYGVYVDDKPYMERHRHVTYLAGSEDQARRMHQQINLYTKSRKRNN